MDRMFIIVKTQLEAVHEYPGAPSEVSFLKYPHRHIFYIEVEIEVLSDDRELEFIIIKRLVDKLLCRVIPAGNYQCTLSCEQIARRLQLKLKESLGESSTYRAVNVKVFEDGENGCYLKDIGG